MQLKGGGKFHLKINISKRPIANKYREGKMQRTLKRESKVLEIAEREAVGSSTCALESNSGVVCQHRFGLRDIAWEEVERPCFGGCPLL